MGMTITTGSNWNSGARNSAEFRATVLELRGIARCLQGSQVKSTCDENTNDYHAQLALLLEGGEIFFLYWSERGGLRSGLPPVK